MSTLTLSFEEQKITGFKEMAREMNLSLEELVGLFLEEFARTRRARFLSSKKRVLAKNRELYKRLA